ncbi:hypoxanthine phosphoribosyltransferase [Breoghania sp.]|uniref:hypoxanthine phosphoribosyltransferase n=1 Tax=Breoghania sp. TaxID=2065378 RepID=UPI002603789E|nr:hypoxanthine phosphoribosyltransferase [Breoghania sp.]MDJ0930452.1 hypoxanthine phosphoribosyltransferase [Breoghania sp.]
MTTTPEIAVLYDEDVIAQRVDEIARALAEAKPERLLAVAILKGSFVFAADLIRAMHRAGLMPEMEFLHLSSYGAGTQSSGTVRILRDIGSDVAGRDVLLIDDILESGRTLLFARNLIASRGARSVSVAALLDKPGRRGADLEADYVGFTCPDKFVVGYGMDAAYAFRQLPYIGYLVGTDDTASK